MKKEKDVGAQTAFTWTEQQAHPDVCRRKHKGNPQSEAANRKVEPHKPTLGGRVYAWFAAQGPMGGTTEECEVALGFRRSTASARVAELRADRWLIPTGQTRNTSSGAQAAVLRAVSKAEHDAARAAQKGNP